MSLADVTSSVPLLLLVFFVAMTYASVGHGGASGYLAILSFMSVPILQMAGTALVLNVLVSSLALWSFLKGGHALPRFTWMLIVASVPLSFLGGSLHVSAITYRYLLAIALIVAAGRLALKPRSNESHELNSPHPLALAASGGAIGLVSGMVGVGGGIFLSPLAIMLQWTTVKSAATLSALFILVNSLSGLAGRAISNRLDIAPLATFLLAAVFGGLAGSWLGARKLPPHWLRIILAAVLLFASLKLLLT